MTSLSRVAGLAREVITAKVFGAGAANDAFEIAFLLPNMMRRLFAEGAFAQAFVPLIAEYKGQRGEAATHQLINRVATLQLVALLVVTALGIAAAPWLIPLFASGFDKTPGKTLLATQMLQVMFPYLLFISLTALAGGVMNIWKRFAIPAFTPVLLNVCMIGAALWAAPYFEKPIMALAWGVLAGGVAQLALQLWPLYQVGMFPRWDFHFRDEGVKRMLKTMAPAILGVSVAQLSQLINTNYASFLGDGSVSWLNKGGRIMELPTALLGVAIGTVILPALGVLRNEKNTRGYGELLDYGMRFALLATLPAMAVMGVLATPMIATLLQRGAFTAMDSIKTGPVVAAYAVGHRRAGLDQDSGAGLLCATGHEDARQNCGACAADFAVVQSAVHLVLGAKTRAGLWTCRTSAFHKSGCRAQCVVALSRLAPTGTLRPAIRMAAVRLAAIGRNAVHSRHSHTRKTRGRMVDVGG
jgi:putative peptidoglycan lipid II flippase